jgi:hypothetical protein
MGTKRADARTTVETEEKYMTLFLVASGVEHAAARE